MATATSAPPTTNSAPLQKTELNALIKLAAAGDQAAAQRLISPFVSPGERLINHGVTAKFGIFPTYDFLFLTDRQVGDLQITPLTGNLNVEVAYLSKVDMFILNQPAFPILLRLFLWSSYLWVPGLFIWIALALFGGGFLGLVFGLGACALGGFLAYAAVNPAVARSFLHFRKSGLWFKLQGSNVGVLIFADRDRFEMMTKVSRQVSEIKRMLDARSN